MTKRLILNGYLSSFIANDATENFVELDDRFIIVNGETTSVSELVDLEIGAGKLVSASDFSVTLSPQDEGYFEAQREMVKQLQASSYYKRKQEQLAAAQDSKPSFAAKIKDAVEISVKNKAQ